MENSTQKCQPLADSWNPQWPKKSWMLALRNRLTAIYGNGLTTLSDDANRSLWIETWAQGLSGVSGEQLRFGLEQAAKDTKSFPPTLGTFRSWCISTPKAQEALPKEDWESTEGHAEECMIKIKEMLSNPRPAGKWWAREILAKVEAGGSVTMTQQRMAEEALKDDRVEASWE